MFPKRNKRSRNEERGHVPSSRLLRPGRSAKGERDRAPADFSGRVADGLASWPGQSIDHRVDILRFYKRFCILKNEALLALMQMQPFMLYEALSFTPIKFIDTS
jgi:hypothetical protein